MSSIKLFIPENIRERKHRADSSEWVKTYYYKDRKRTEVEEEKILSLENEYDLLCTSLKVYQRNVFYKLSQLSKKDPMFDYYCKLKNDVPDEVLKKYHKFDPCKNIGTKNKNPTFKKDFERPVYEKSKCGKYFVVRFN